MDNIWLGVSVENQEQAEIRVGELLNIPARIRLLSVEPLLGLVGLSRWLRGIHWVIVGGESGQQARPMKAEWVRPIRDICQIEEVPFHFKQWGEHHPELGKVGKKAAGRLLDGREWSEFPA